MNGFPADRDNINNFYIQNSQLEINNKVDGDGGKNALTAKVEE
jgi:hypothetical protein